jgi:sugar-specific transcriptional regulator TrmB
MAETPIQAATKRPPVTISDKSREIIEGVRQMLDEASDEAIAASETYAADLLIDLLDQVENALTRVSKFTKRVKVASKRKTIKTLRKKQRGEA